LTASGLRPVSVVANERRLLSSPNWIASVFCGVPSSWGGRKYAVGVPAPSVST
jgi:hypothetical protein